MRSPTRALLWAICHRHRAIVALIVGVTSVGRLMDASEQAAGVSPDDSSSVIVLCWMTAFTLLFGVFNYTEARGSAGIGGFPRRLFVLPVSTLRLVTVPMLTGVAAIELLYVSWLGTLSRGGSTSPLFVAALLGALMVFYQAALWTLDRLGAARLVVVGALAIAMYLVALLPSWPPTPPPPWRTEPAIAVTVVGAALAVFLFAWRHVASLRAGGAGRRRRFGLELAMASLGTLVPTRSQAFRTPHAAHFWYEWRTSGLVLPALVLGVLLIVLMPASWLTRNSAADSWALLIATLAMPAALAVPVGMAFSRPTFWSEDMSLPAFVAVRPLTDEDLVVVKVRVAMASTLLSWLLVLAFLVTWLSLWANLDGLSRFAIQLWAFHGHSAIRVYGIATLIVSAAIVLTWRSLVSRLWSGLLGDRRLFVASVTAIVVAGIASMVLDATRLPGWILENPDRMAGAVWVLAVLVIAKGWLAAFAWRSISRSRAGRYLLVWTVGTTCLGVLGVVVWDVMRIYVPLDVARFNSLVILLALLAVPLGRLGLAPFCLARNRHR